MSAVAHSQRPRFEGQHVTREEYLDLEDDGYSYEMIHGVLQVSPSPNFEHGDLLMLFGHLLRSFLKVHDLGRAAVDVDVLLPDGGDVLRPDLLFLLNANLSRIRTHVHGAPDMVCEVLSDRTAARDLGEKADRYLTCGVREYWILDPRDRTMQLWVNAAGTWQRQTGAVLQSVVLPGFTVNAAELYPRL